MEAAVLQEKEKDKRRGEGRDGRKTEGKKKREGTVEEEDKKTGR
jgi:hypothetical protein